MTEARESLRTHTNVLVAMGIAWVRRARRLQRLINIVCVLGGAILSTVGGAMEGGLVPEHVGGLTIKGICVGAGAILVFVGGVMLLFLQDEGPEIIDRAAQLATQAQTHLDEREALLSRIEASAQLDRKRLALLDANRTMREALEQALLLPGANAVGATQVMLTTAQRFIVAAIGFEADEEWAISVFRRETDQSGEILRRVAAARADRLTEQNAPRSWRQNQGFVGAAWVSNRDTIIEDGNDPQVAADYPVPSDCRKPYDSDRYRSMAAIPVRLGPHQSVWGVVAASSNMKGRFRRDPGNKQVQTVDTVRALARMTALCVAAFDRALE